MRKLMTLALLAAGVGAIVALPAAAKPPHTNGKLVVNVDNPVTGTEQVYTVDPDGTNRELLYDNAEVGQWSPDGRRVPLTLQPSAQELLLNVDTGRTTDLGLPFDHYLDLALFCGVWSPDGSRLACEGFGQTDGSLNGVYTLRASDGGGLQRVTSDPNGDDCPSDYSPDGKRLVITRASDTSYELDTVKLDGSGLKHLTPAGTDFDFCSGSWSPQGNEIVFSVHVTPDVHSSIWVVHADGSGLHEVNVQPTADCGGLIVDLSAQGCNQPVWSPDGTKIAFIRSFHNPDDGEIYTVNVDGTGLFQVTHTPGVDGVDWGTHPPTE
jgi:Tol biopolymer transport system component